MTLARPTPPVSRSAFRVLAVVLDMQAAGERPKVRAIGQRLGWTSPHHTHRCLYELRRAGLVAWEDGRGGTLIATCRVIAASEL